MGLVIVIYMAPSQIIHNFVGPPTVTVLKLCRPHLQIQPAHPPSLTILVTVANRKIARICHENTNTIFWKIIYSVLGIQPRNEQVLCFLNFQD